MPTFLLVLLTAIYLLRPSDWIPGASSIPFFQLAIIPCLAISLDKLSAKLQAPSLRENPVTRCVLGLLLVAFCSQVINAPGEIATTFGFSKACVFYMLIVSILDSLDRQCTYLKALAWIIFILALLMILGQGGDIVAHKADRAEALGGKNFDPNDTAAILIIGILICGHFAVTYSGLVWRVVWAVPAVVTAIGLKLTDSRGGFLALVVGVAAYVTLRWGKRGVLLGVCVLPAIAMLLATGRTFEANAISQGTGQARVQLWHDGFVVFEHHPILGIGPDQFTNFVGKASHNSFVQSYAELGAFGGTFFVGAFYFAVAGIYRSALWNLQSENGSGIDPILVLMCSIASAYAMAIFALNHLYSAGTYLVLGLSAAACDAHRRFDNSGIAPTPDFAKQLMFVSAGFLVFIYTAAKLLVSW